MWFGLGAGRGKTRAFSPARKTRSDTPPALFSPAAKIRARLVVVRVFPRPAPSPHELFYMRGSREAEVVTLTYWKKRGSPSKCKSSAGEGKDSPFALREAAVWATQVKTRATRERAWLILTDSSFYLCEYESGGGASERIFRAGENERVLTWVARTARHSIERERYGGNKSPADLITWTCAWP